MELLPWLGVAPVERDAFVVCCEGYGTSGVVPTGLWGDDFDWPWRRQPWHPPLAAAETQRAENRNEFGHSEIIYYSKIYLSTKCHSS